jgi:hypothetical protein
MAEDLQGLSPFGEENYHQCAITHRALVGSLPIHSALGISPIPKPRFDRSGTS